MDEHDVLAERFERHRAHLRAVAYRVLGSLSEAEDAVQEAWLRLQRSDADGVENLGGWLTTVVSRVALDMLRSRRSRREEPLRDEPAGRGAPSAASDPEQEALLADSVGLALLVVLETLPPAERLAFVLHDLFAVPFEEIAPIVERSPTATRQLASRARRRVQGAESIDERAPTDAARRREVVEAFLAASRGGDFEALLAVLDPDVVLRADRALLAPDAPAEVSGARAVARAHLAAARGARFARAAIVNGRPGVVVAPGGRLLLVLQLTFADARIAAIDAIADPARLADVELAVMR